MAESPDSARKVTIVIADAFRLVRQGLRLLLEGRAGFSVLAETSDGLQVADMVEALAPRVLLTDLFLPGLGGLDIAWVVSRRSPRTRILVLSRHEEPALASEAFRNGASAYFLKGSGAGRLVDAVRAVLRGQRYLSHPMTMKEVEAHARSSADAAEVHGRLTRRERETLHLAAEGLTNTSVAERLCISPRTAESHRSHAMHKLGLRSRLELIRYAYHRGILSS